jgi:hypothetical protein
MTDELQPIEIRAEDARGFRHPTPPSECIEHSAIRAAAEQYERNRDAATEADRVLTDLEQRRPAADEADREAYADALQARHKDPGTRHADAADRAIADARRHADALATIAARSLDAFAEAVASGQADWHAATVAKRDAARARLAEQVAAIGDTLAELDTLDVLTRYTAGRASRLVLPTGPTVPADPSRHGDVTTAVALGALQRRAVPPAPPAPRTYMGPDGESHEIRLGSGALRVVELSA